MSSIRIIKLPQGIAPEWVRQEWVGLEISLTTPTNDFATQYIGYEVSIQTALWVLKRKSKQAADWFTANLTPSQLQGNFKFREEECEYLP